jgi:DNA-binding beta-propeller fold protein YncE
MTDKLSAFLLYALCFFALCSLLFIPHKLNAQPLGTLLLYSDSITHDEEGKRLYLPSFVTTDLSRKEIYVIDSRARVIIYTSDFFPFFTLDKNIGIESPQGLAIDSKGNLYVAQAATKNSPKHRISVFNACFKWERDIYLEGFEGADSFLPHHLAVDKKGNIYVVAIYFPGALVLDSNGHLLEIISPEEEDKKVRLNSVILDEAGRIYLVSEEKGRIYVYDENRRFLFKFGEKGGSTGKLSRPKAIGVDNRNGRMYVVDYMRHTISVYDEKGNYLFEFGGLGWGTGWFQFPVDLAVDSMGRVLVADLFNNRVQVFKPKE